MSLRLLFTYIHPSDSPFFDILLWAFAKEYCSKNENSFFESENSAYIFSVSLINLNLQYLIQSIQPKTTLKDFIKGSNGFFFFFKLKGINGKKNLPINFLKESFLDITQNTIKLY
jgi:Sec7-like guanine-nucleotide exchange factor